MATYDVTHDDVDQGPSTTFQTGDITRILNLIRRMKQGDAVTINRSDTQ